MSDAEKYVVSSPRGRVFLRLERNHVDDERWIVTANLQNATLFTQYAVSGYTELCNDGGGLGHIQDWEPRQVAQIVLFTDDKKHAEYRSGYGQARADALGAIKEGQAFVVSELRHYEPYKAQLKDLRDKHLALRWAHSLIKTMKSSR